MITHEVPPFEEPPYDQSMAMPAYRSLSKRTGRPLTEVIHLADQNRLNELFDESGNLVEVTGWRASARAFVERRWRAMFG